MRLHEEGVVGEHTPVDEMVVTTGCQRPMVLILSVLVLDATDTPGRDTPVPQPEQTHIREPAVPNTGDTTTDGR